jgi:hypothetical protein
MVAGFAEVTIGKTFWLPGLDFSQRPPKHNVSPAGGVGLQKIVLGLRCHRITMVKTGESRQGFNLAFTLRANFCRPTCGRVLREPEMCPVLVKVEQVRKHRPFEMPLIQDHFAGVPRFGEAHRKLEATKSKRAMKRELMVVAVLQTYLNSTAANTRCGTVSLTCNPLRRVKSYGTVSNTSA